MNKIKLILVAFGLVLSTTLSAATEPAETLKSPTSTEISELLESPNFLVQEDMSGYVTFILNKENEIVVLSVETESDILETYIKSRLNYQKLKVNLKKGTEYIVPVKITAIN